MKRSALHLWLILLWCVSGCASEGASSASASDRTKLVVTVLAQPKAGWSDPRNESVYSGAAQIGQSQQFQTIDYAALDEIVVWVEPRGVTNSGVRPTRNVVIDLTQPSPALLLAEGGAIWDMRNRTGRPLDVYLRSESGAVTNLGRVPGAGASFGPRAEGFAEVMIEGRPDPIARVFITPTRWARVTESGRKVTFDDVPSGPARIMSWHSRLPGSQTDVTIEPGRTAAATVTVSVNSLPKVK